MGGGAVVVDGGVCTGGIEERGAGCEVFLRKQLRDGDLGDAGVRDVPRGVGEGDAEGFDQSVEVGRGVVVFLFEDRDLAGFLELLEDPEGHEGYDSLTVRRVLPDFYALWIVTGTRAVALGLEDLGDGLDGLAADLHVMGQIIEGQKAAEVAGHFDDFGGDAASVEAFLAVLAECAKCGGEMGVAEELTLTRGAMRAVCFLDEHFAVVGGGFLEEAFAFFPLLQMSVAVSTY